MSFNKIIFISLIGFYCFGQVTGFESIINKNNTVQIIADNKLLKSRSF